MPPRCRHHAAASRRPLNYIVVPSGTCSKPGYCSEGKPRFRTRMNTYWALLNYSTIEMRLNTAPTGTVILFLHAGHLSCTFMAVWCCLRLHAQHCRMHACLVCLAPSNSAATVRPTVICDGSVAIPLLSSSPRCRFLRSNAGKRRCEKRNHKQGDHGRDGGSSALRMSLAD
jgi:hypothetical protein